MARRAWCWVALGATLILAEQAEGQSPQVTLLDQGWPADIREAFYFTPQGSRLIPLDWLLALEAEDGGRFADLANLARYGFIAPDGASALNPGGLPIGFALQPRANATVQYEALAAEPRRSVGDEQLVGLTCAACHTAEITIEGKRLRIDGGPANLDFDRFYADLAATVTRTLFEAGAYGRFAQRVLGADAPPTAAAELRLRFADVEARLAGDAVLRHPALASGFGRVDALTQIINALAVVAQGEPQNLRAVAAPTSYPHLWLTPELEFVQWNPIAASPIGRNGGEVLGVFGTSVMNGPPEGWYASSLLVRELALLESWVAMLKPPAWDEAVMGAIDRPLAARGETLFEEHCAGCHNLPPYARTDPSQNFFQKTFIRIGRVDYRKVGTDPAYIDSLVQRLVRTNPATAQALGGQAIVPAPAYFLRTAGAIVTRAMDETGLTAEEKAAVNGFRLRPPAVPGGAPEPYVPPSVTDLKAGPLAGAWATGPYLHNGSVATIDELLRPVAERRAVFWTGGRELDRERLGFVSDDAPGRFRFDTSLPGNRNAGHLYPEGGLGPDDRRAVLEYLKTM